MNFIPITHVDPTLILHQIDARPDLWDQRPERRTAPGTPHSGMTDIWVRYNHPDRLTKPGFNDEHVPTNYPAWYALPAVRRVCLGLMALVEGEMLGGVLITRIPHSHSIARHVDRGWHVDYFQKFYVALRSAPGAVFHCEADGKQDSLCPEPGAVHLFDNRKPHWVTNDSGQDRMTLIVCIRTEKEFGQCLSPL